jgi:pilus assembly protein Flp/PilA
MNYLHLKIKEFLLDERGATAVEYGLMAALIAGVIITAVTTVGTDLNSVFTKIGTKLTSAAAAMP